MLTILGEYYQNGMEDDHLAMKNLPYKLLYFSPGRFEPASKCSDMKDIMSAFVTTIS